MHRTASDIGQRVARQPPRIEGLAVLAEAAAARYHEGDRNHREHREPDSHHADQAERRVSDLSARVWSPSTKEGAEGLTSAATGTATSFTADSDRPNRLATAGVLDDGAASPRRAAEPADLARAQDRAAGRRVGRRAAGTNSRPDRNRCSGPRTRAPRSPRSALPSATASQFLGGGDGVAAKNGADEKPGGHEDGKSEREADEEYDNGGAKLRDGHGKTPPGWRSGKPASCKDFPYRVVFAAGRLPPARLNKPIPLRPRLSFSSSL